MKKGLIPDRSRPGNVVVLDFYGLGRHLVIDAVISTVYRNTIFSATSLIPGHMAKLAEDTRSFEKADELSSLPVSCKHGGDHVLVPFAMEDAGTLDGSPCTCALEDSCCASSLCWPLYSSPDSRSSPLLSPSFRRRRFGCSAGRNPQNRLSTWLHVSLSRFSVFTSGLQGLSASL